MTEGHYGDTGLKEPIRVEPDGGVNRDGVYPTDNCDEKGSFSYGMLVVKPTGMEGDFPDLMQYLFDPRSRNHPHFKEVAKYIEMTLDVKHRKTFREILNATTLEVSFYGAYEPDQDPYFWEANYLRKNGEKFYYQEMLDGFRGGKTAEIFLLRSTVPQDKFDKWLREVKGRESLVQTDSNSGETRVLYKGFGIRGLLEVEAIMLTAEKKDELLRGIRDPEKRTIVEHLLSGMKLPIIYSQLPEVIQEALWTGLSPAEQQAMICNFIHSPNDIQTTYDAVLALARLELGEQRVKEILTGTTEPESAAIFDLMTEVLRQRVEIMSEQKGMEAVRLIQEHPGNIRGAYWDMEGDSAKK